MMEPLPPRPLEKADASRVGHAWRPLQGLAAPERAYDFNLMERWKARWDEFRARPDVQVRLRQGIQRLERLWSIETGLLEGLYTLNWNTTTTLLEHGFVPGAIRAQDTNINPDLLMAILNDHQTSVELVHGYIREERALSAHTIRELHASRPTRPPTRWWTVWGAQASVPCAGGCSSSTPTIPPGLMVECISTVPRNRWTAR